MGTEARFFDQRGLFALTALLFLTVLLYMPALPGPLLLDDSTVIEPLLSLAQRGHDWRSFLFNDSGPLGRPLAMASFIFDAAVHGDHLRHWKATNLALHAVNGVLIYALLMALGQAIGRDQAALRVLAVGSAALWLLHPLNVSTVMYLTQRMTQLSTLFSLLALLLYARGRLAGAKTVRAQGLILTAVFICTPLAAFSKEIGLLTPYYLALLEVCVFAGQASPRPRWLRILLVTITVLPLVVAAVYLASHWSSRIVGPYALREFGPLERVLTEAHVVLRYLGWIVMPRRAAFGFFHDDVAIAHWPPNFATLVALCALASILAVAWCWRQRAPLVAFGVLLFFCAHALESTVFPLELVFEHRNYLPAIGICLALAAATIQLLTLRHGSVLLASLALLYGLVTATMTPTWGHEGTLYASFFHDHPRSLRARGTFVEWLLARGDLVNAERVLGTSHDRAAQLHRLRLACLRDGKAGQALAALNAVASAPRPDDMTIQILLWLARQAQDGPCVIDADRVVRTIEAIRDRPLSTNSRLRLYVVSAQLRHRAGDLVKAGLAAATAAEIVPGDPYPRLLGAEIALDANDRRSARTLLEHARDLARTQHEEFEAMLLSLEARLQAP